MAKHDSGRTAAPHSHSGQHHKDGGRGFSVHSPGRTPAQRHGAGESGEQKGGR